MRYLITFSVVVEIILLLPIFYLITKINFDYSILTSCLNPLLNTIGISIIASLISLLISIPISVIIVKDIKFFSKLFYILSGSLLSIPDLILGIALLMIYGNNGIMSMIFGNIFVNTLIGVILAEVYIITPYSTNMLVSLLKNIDISLIESVYALGSSDFKVMYYVYIKMQLRSILRILMTNISYSLSIFSVVLIFSYYPKIMTTQIFEDFRLFEFNKALVLSSYLVILSIMSYIILLVEKYIHEKQIMT